MLFLAKLENKVLALVVFGVLRLATSSMGDAAWIVALVGTIVVFFALRALLVRPLLNAATRNASEKIMAHFAGGGDMSGPSKSRVDSV